MSVISGVVQRLAKLQTMNSSDNLGSKAGQKLVVVRKTEKLGERDNVRPYFPQREKDKMMMMMTKNNLVILPEPILNFGQDPVQRGEKGVDSMVILWFRLRTSSTGVLVFPD